MTNFKSRERAVSGTASTPSRDRSQGTESSASQPLPPGEIETLLRMAREHAQQMVSNTPMEELGPGDVQYLRGLSAGQPMIDTDVASKNWPGQASDPDALLSQAEKHLAEAILDSKGPRGEPASNSSDHTPPGIRSVRRPISGPGLTIEDLGDVELDISIELGRTEILIEDVLKLREGSVVALDKLAGDPVDIVANGRLVARGELLVIDGNFGVRLSEVL